MDKCCNVCILSLPSEPQDTSTWWGYKVRDMHNHITCFISASSSSFWTVKHFPPYSSVPTMQRMSSWSRRLWSGSWMGAWCWSSPTASPPSRTLTPWRCWASGVWWSVVSTHSSWATAKASSGSWWRNKPSFKRGKSKRCVEKSCGRGGGALNVEKLPLVVWWCANHAALCYTPQSVSGVCESV